MAEQQVAVAFLPHTGRVFSVSSRRAELSYHVHEMTVSLSNVPLDGHRDE